MHPNLLWVLWNFEWNGHFHHGEIGQPLSEWRPIGTDGELVH
jgi:hypothetical protein